MTFHIFLYSSCEHGCELSQETLDFECKPDPENVKTAVQSSDESTQLRTTTEESKPKNSPPRRPSAQIPSNCQPGTQNTITTVTNQYNGSPSEALGSSQSSSQIQPKYYYYQLPVPVVQSQPNYQPPVVQPITQPPVVQPVMQPQVVQPIQHQSNVVSQPSNPVQHQPNVVSQPSNPVKQYDCDPLINNLIHFAHNLN